MATYPHPSSTTRVSISPSASGTPVRVALAVESALNILFATYLLVYPDNVVDFLSSPHDSKIFASAPGPLASTLVQILAVMTYAITLPLLISIPNSRRGIESRIPTYLFLGGSEVLLISFFLYLGFVKSEVDTGFSEKQALAFVGNLLPPLAFRGFVLGVKPEWVGQYADADVGKKE